MFRFLQIVTLSLLGVLMTDSTLSDIELPKVSGWKFPDGTMVFNEYHLMKAGIRCELTMCAYPAGTTSRCDDGNLFAASGRLYDDYGSESGAIAISYSPAVEIIKPSLKEKTDG